MLNLTLIGLSPSKELEKVLLANQVSVHTFPKGKLPPSHPVDLFLVLVQKKAELEIVPKLRKNFPQCWIQIVLDQKRLEDPKFYSAVLECKEKNGVSFVQSWEATLWLTFDQMNRQAALENTLHSQATEIDSLKQSVADLTRHTHQLIAQFEKNVSLAENIQRSMLPKFSPQIPGINISAKYIPSLGVGGDYYDIFEFGDKRRFGVILSDSKTHGMAAALLSILIKLRLEEMKDRFSDTAHFLHFLNREFHSTYHKDISSLTLLYGIMDRVTLTFQFTVAGALQPLLFRNGHTVPIPRSSCPALGEMDHFTFQENRVTLKPGDTLILHTDGLNLLFEGNPTLYFSNRVFSKEGVHDPLLIQNTVLAKLDQYKEGNTLKDDITLIQFLIDERAMYLAQQQ